MLWLYSKQAKRLVALSLAFLLLFVIALPHNVLAQRKRKSRMIPIAESEVSYIQIGRRTVACAPVNGKMMPGKTKSRRGQLMFKPMSKAGSGKARARGRKRNRRAGNDNYRRFLQGCRKSGGGNNSPGEDSPQQPMPAPSGSLIAYSGQWTARQVKHLYRRAGFGATQAQVQQSLSDGLHGTLERLFTVVSTPEIDRAVRAIIDQARDDEGNASDWGIRRGEIYRMINSPNQLREKMKFFLHELYIASYTAADGDAIFFQEYIDLLRSHAFGNVIALSQAVSNSGLMLRYLDGETNVAGSVNENYARELMELFALGVGHYTERDVNEAARALTGWTLVWNQNTQRNYVAFRAADHDTGVKNLFEGTAWAQSGNFNMQDIVRIVYAHPQAPRYLARRLLEFFVGGRFQEQHIEALAATILANDWQLAPTVRTLLSSELFYSPGAIKSKLKTPLEHSIGFIRGLQLPFDVNEVDWRLMAQGQEIYNPPSVKGWESDKWLNNQWMVERANFAQGMINSGHAEFDTIDFRYLMPNASASADQMLDALLARMDAEVSPDERALMLQYLSNARDWDGQTRSWFFSTSDSFTFASKVGGLVYLLHSHPNAYLN